MIDKQLWAPDATFPIMHKLFIIMDYIHAEPSHVNILSTGAFVSGTLIQLTCQGEDIRISSIESPPLFGNFMVWPQMSLTFIIITVKFAYISSNLFITKQLQMIFFT